MSSSTFFTIVLLVLLRSCAISAYDIVIYTSTPGGIAAAITAARLAPSLSILIIEPTQEIGGMSYAGGIGLRDLGLEITSAFLSRSYAFSLSCF